MDPEDLLADAGWLRRLARRLVDDDRGEDAVQETLMAAMRRGRPAPRSWLVRVLRSRIVDGERSRARRAQRESAAARSAVEPSTADMVERLEVQRSLHDALLSLGESDMRLLLWRYQDDLELADIARRSGSSIEAVRSRIRRALDRVRARLDRRCGDRDDWVAALAPWVLEVAHHAPVPSATAAASSLRIGPRLLRAIAAAVIAVTAAAVAWRVGVAPIPRDESAEWALVAAAPSDDPEARAADLGVVGAGDSRTAPLGAGADATLRVSGEVVDADTWAPLAGAGVWLRRRSGTADHGAESARTDALGRFVIDVPWTTLEGGDAPAELTLEVRAVDRSLALRHFAVDPRAPRGGVVANLGSIEVVRGTIVRGHVEDVDGRPIAGAAVYHVDRHGESTPVAITDDRGNFRTDRPLAGDGLGDRLVAVGPAAIGWSLVRLGRRAAERAEVLRCEPCGTVEIAVRTAGDRPVAGATVTWRPRGSLVEEPWLQAAFRPDGRLAQRGAVLTDRDGVATLRGVSSLGGPVGEVEVVITRPGWSRERATVRVRAGALQRHVIHVDDAARTWRGRVTNRDDRPVAGARVHAEGVDGRLLAVGDTGSDGGFAFVCGSPARLRIVAPGFAPHVEDAPRSALHVRLTAVRTIVGRVRDAQGVAVVGAAVGGAGAADSGVRTDVTGAFVLAVPVARAVDLAIAPPPPLGVWRSHPPVRVDAAVSRIDMTLDRTTSGATLIAQALDGAGAPLDVRDALLLPDAGADEDPHPVRCMPGRVVADDLWPGRWHLLAWTFDGRSLRASFDLEPGMDAVWTELRDEPTCTVDGEIDVAGLPAELRNVVPLTVVHSAFRNARWVDPARGGDVLTGARLPGPAHVLRLDPGRLRFRLEGISPLQQRVDFRLSASGGIVGSAGVEVRPGETAQVALRAMLGAEVTFVWRGGQTGRTSVVYQRGLGPDGWMPWATVGVIPAGAREHALAPLALRPGSYRFAVAVAALGADEGAFAPFRPAPADLRVVGHGAFDVGAERAIEVDVTPR